MIKENQIANKVRVKLNANFEINSLSDNYLACEPVIYISGIAYLNGSRFKWS